MNGQNDESRASDGARAGLTAPLPDPTVDNDTDSESETDDEILHDSDQNSAAREKERLRVMEAAGLVVQAAPPSHQRRRPPPPRPRPVSTASDIEARPAASPALSFATAAEEAPSESEQPAETDFTAEDAYAQWQKLQGNAGTASRQQTDQQALLAALSSLSHGQGQVQGETRKTWSSLVDSGTLATIPDQERKRQEAIFELIKTESGYLETLQLVVQEYYAKAQGLLEDKTVQVIFANIEDILLWSVVSISKYTLQWAARLTKSPDILL